MLEQTITEQALDKTVQTQAINDPLPSHWEVVKLGDLGTISGGSTPSTKELEYWSGNIPWLTPSEVTKYQGLIISETDRHITEEGLANCSAKLLPIGTVLMTSRATIGEVVINAVPMVTNQGFINISCDEDKVFNEFLAYWIKQNKHKIETYANGVTFREVSKSSFRNITALLPPLIQQRTIAHILQTAQEAIQARRRELELEQERKAALIEYLFSHGTRGESTKQTEIGKIPQSWEIVRLGELCANNLGFIQTGPFGSQLHASDYRDQGIPVINPTHLGINTIVEDLVPLISEEDAERLSKHYLVEGDVLVSRRGDFSRYSYITYQQAGWVCGTGCLLIRLNNPKVDNQFFAISIGTESIQNYLEYTATGTIMPNLNTKILEGLPLALPSTLDEQQQIVATWSACTSKISALEKEITLLDELFRALLEELMTGRLSTLPLIGEGETHE